MTIEMTPDWLQADNLFNSRDMVAFHRVLPT